MIRGATKEVSLILEAAVMLVAAINQEMKIPTRISNTTTKRTTNALPTSKARPLSGATAPTTITSSKLNDPTTDRAEAGKTTAELHSTVTISPTLRNTIATNEAGLEVQSVSRSESNTIIKTKALTNPSPGLGPSADHSLHYGGLSLFA